MGEIVSKFTQEKIHFPDELKVELEMLQKQIKEDERVEISERYQINFWKELATEISYPVRAQIRELNGLLEEIFRSGPLLDDRPLTPDEYLELNFGKEYKEKVSQERSIRQKISNLENRVKEIFDNIGWV